MWDEMGRNILYCRVTWEVAFRTDGVFIEQSHRKKQVGTSTSF